MPLAEAELRVLELRCPACAEHIEADLANHPGIERAAVEYSRDLARVSYDPEQIDKDRIRALIAERGYRCAMDGARAREPRTAAQLGHDAQLAPICCGTKHDRMQYELGIELRPEWSALLMSLSSIIVATNAVLLRRVEGQLAGG